MPNLLPTGNSTANNLINMATIMEEADSKSRKEGIPSTPAQVSSSEPLFGSSRGYKPTTDLSGIDTGAVMDPNVGNVLATGKPVYVKAGTKGKIGSDQFKARESLLPYITSESLTPEERQQNMVLMGSEPDDAKFLAGLKVAPRKPERQMIITKDVSKSLKDAGFDVPEGTIMKEREYKNMLEALDAGFKATREKRLSGSIEIDQAIKRANLKLKELNIKNKAVDAAVNAAIEAALAPKKVKTADVQTSTGTDKRTPFQILEDTFLKE